MADITLANTSAGLSTKTVVTAEGAHTVTGLHTFDRDPNAPFAVASGSAVVTNLDADKLDGLEASAFATISGTETFTNKTLTSPTVNSPTIATPTITGAVTLSGGQLAFPASQSASAGANTLDDYEEGAWTPVIGGAGGTSGQAYSSQVGSYVKIGKFVFCYFDVRLSTEGTITGNAQISGLPFTSENTSNLNAATSLWFDALATNWVQVFAVIGSNVTVAALQGIQAAGTSSATALTASDIDNTTRFIGTLFYRASA